jgi:hypothetical protein
LARAPESSPARLGISLWSPPSFHQTSPERISK